jgi:uncharacterized protein (DUF2062 family)
VVSLLVGREPAVGLPYIAHSIIYLKRGRIAFKMRRFRELLKKLLQIEDTPERTALAYAIGIFLGFSPFLGIHTLSGLAVAFLFKLNRVAILLGVWSNTPWWLVPYYTLATWLGMWVVRFRIDWATLEGMFQLGKEKGFLTSEFWMQIASQWGLLASFLTGSMILALLLSLIAYPLSLRGIRFYRSQKAKGREHTVI